MSLRQRIAAIINWASEQRETPIYSDPSLSYGTGPQWQDWNVKRAVKEGFKAHYAVHAVTTKLADCVKQPPWVLKRKTVDGSDIIDKHELVDLIRQPNPEEEWSTLVEGVDIFKSIAGNAYQLISQEGGVHIWPLRPDRIQIKPDERGHIGAYEYDIGSGKKKRYEIEEVIHHRFFNPSDDFYGLSPLQAAARIVDTSNATIDWNKVAMDNRTRPDMIFWPDDELKKEQYDLFRKQLTNQAQGKKSAKKTLIMPYKGKMQVMGFSAAEMDFLKSFSTYEDAVCWVFGVHPEALGKSDTTFNNKEWATIAMWEGPVESRLRSMRAVYNHKFNLLFGTNWPPAVGDLYLDFDMAGTPAITSRRKEKSKEAKTWFAQGVPFDQVNERLNLGFESFPGSDQSWRPVNMIAEGDSADSVGAGLALGLQHYAPRAINLETDEQKAAQWLAVDRDRQAWEKKGWSLVSKRFDEERDVVVKQIAAGKYDVTIDEKPWIKMLTPLWIAVVEFFGNEMWRDLEMRDFDPYTAPMAEFIDEHVAEAVTKISLTSKTNIKAVVQAGLEEGQSSYQISQGVRGMYNGWSGPYIRPEHAIASRCMTIARTEVGGALGYGHQEAAKQSGVVEKKTWLTSGDDRVRESHRAISGETIPLTERYSNDCMYPCDPSGPASEVVACRCQSLFVTR